jgi:hypothetical protein
MLSNTASIPKKVPAVSDYAVGKAITLERLDQDLLFPPVESDSWRPPLLRGQ